MVTIVARTLEHSIDQEPSTEGGVAPGLVVALAAACLGMLVHQLSDAVSPHVVVIIVVVVAANTGVVRASHRPGLKLAGRRVLRLGIVFVGFRLSLSEVLDLGPRAFAAVCLVVVVTFFGTQLLGRWLGLSSSLSMLIATGYSICGASAIAAVEPFSDATDEDVAYAIALVTLCGSLAIGVLPTLGSLLGLSSHAFGSWVGASVHDVGQVVAAASIRDATALKAAVVVKLTRVSLLAPLLLGIAVSARRRASRSAGSASIAGPELVEGPAVGTRRPPILPMFIVMFLVAAAVRSTGTLSTGALSGIKQVETLMLGMGLAGLGSGVDIRRLRRLGGRPLALGLASWVLVAAAALGAVTVIA